MARRIRYTLDRAFTCSVTFADGASEITTTIHAANPYEAESLTRTPTINGHPVARIIVRSATI